MRVKIIMNTERREQCGAGRYFKIPRWSYHFMTNRKPSCLVNLHFPLIYTCVVKS